jgi:hypothetical protein
LKATREKYQPTYELIRITSDHTAEILKYRKTWDDIYGFLKYLSIIALTVYALDAPFKTFRQAGLELT